MNDVSKLIRENILSLVAKYPSTKNNYNLLVTCYWYVHNNARTFSDSANCTSAESITRCFRKLVEEDLIQVVKPIKEKRNKSEKKFKEEYGSKEN